MAAAGAHVVRLQAHTRQQLTQQQRAAHRVRVLLQQPHGRVLVAAFARVAKQVHRVRRRHDVRVALQQVLAGRARVDRPQVVVERAAGQPRAFGVERLELLETAAFARIERARVDAERSPGASHQRGPGLIVASRGSHENGLAVFERACGQSVAEQLHESARVGCCSGLEQSAREPVREPLVRRRVRRRRQRASASSSRSASSAAVSERCACVVAAASTGGDCASSCRICSIHFAAAADGPDMSASCMRQHTHICK